MRNETPLDVFQHNSRLIAQQTGSRVYAPLAVDWQPTPKLSGLARVAIIFGGSAVCWTAVIGFAVMIAAVRG